MRLAALDVQTRATLLDNIASLIFGIIKGLLERVALRDSHIVGSNDPATPTHPSDYAKLQGRDIAFLSSSLRSYWTLSGSHPTSTRSFPHFGRFALLIAPTYHCSQQSMPATTRVHWTAHGLNRVYAAASTSLSALRAAWCRRLPTRRRLRVTSPS